MSSILPLHNLFEINRLCLSKDESLILEAELLIQVCKNLNDFFKDQFKGYFNSIKSASVQESFMLENCFIQLVINDILASDDYSISGIAYHTNIPEEVIYDVIIGKIDCLSLTFSRRIIELHRTVRPDLYKAIAKKIIEEISNTPPNKE